MELKNSKNQIFELLILQLQKLTYNIPSKSKGRGFTHTDLILH